MVHMTYKISNNTKPHNGVTEFSYCRAVSCPQSLHHHISLCTSQLLQQTVRGSRVIPANEHTLESCSIRFSVEKLRHGRGIFCYNSFPITNTTQTISQSSPSSLPSVWQHCCSPVSSSPHTTALNKTRHTQSKHVLQPLNTHFCALRGQQLLSRIF